MQTITFVTQNLNKLSDTQKLLPNIHVQHINFDVPEIQSLQLQEIANYKIQYAYEKVQQPCFVMDTSLELRCLNNFPGPLIKWFFGSVGAHTICQIAQTLHNNQCKRTTILAYYDGKQSTYFQESLTWTLPDTPRGDKWYDRDTIFIPPWDNRTLAEMSFEEKQSYAVTPKLLHRLVNFLQNQ